MKRHAIIVVAILLDVQYLRYQKPCNQCFLVPRSLGFHGWWCQDLTRTAWWPGRSTAMRKQALYFLWPGVGHPTKFQSWIRFRYFSGAWEHWTIGAYGAYGTYGTYGASRSLFGFGKLMKKVSKRDGLNLQRSQLLEPRRRWLVLPGAVQQRHGQVVPMEWWLFRMRSIGRIFGLRKGWLGQPFFMCLKLPKKVPKVTSLEPWGSG